VSEKNPSSWKSISIAAEAERVIIAKAEASLVSDGTRQIVSQMEPRRFAVLEGSMMEPRRFDENEMEPRRFDLIEGVREKVSRIEPRRLD